MDIRPARKAESAHHRVGRYLRPISSNGALRKTHRSRAIGRGSTRCHCSDAFATDDARAVNRLCAGAPRAGDAGGVVRAVSDRLLNSSSERCLFPSCPCPLLRSLLRLLIPINCSDYWRFLQELSRSPDGTTGEDHCVAFGGVVHRGVTARALSCRFSRCWPTCWMTSCEWWICSTI